MALSLFSPKNSDSYSPLESSDSEIGESKIQLGEKRTKQWSRIQVLLLLIVSVVVSSISAFSIGARGQIPPDRVLLGKP